MQQLNTILLAPTSTAQSAKLGQVGIAHSHLEDAETQDFALHLGQLIEQLEERRPGDSKPAQHSLHGITKAAGKEKSEEAAVSDLVRTIELKVDNEGTPVEDTWLAMVEELNAVAEGKVNLAQVSARRGLDTQTLKAQLEQALAEFEGDAQALLVELQRFSSGKALPAAESEEQNKITIAEPPPLQEAFEKFVMEKDIEALLAHVATLQTSEQVDFAVEVNALLSKLKQLEIEGDGTQPEGFISSTMVTTMASDTEFAIELQALSDSLAKQLNEVLNHDAELTEQERAHLQQLGLVDEEKEWLPQVDNRALEKELRRLLSELESEFEGANPSELIATLETQLQELAAHQLTASNSENEPSDKLVRLNQLLTEFNVKLENIQAETRVIDGGRALESGSKLPLVAQALSMASNELKTQLQQALQAQQSGGDSNDSHPGEFDNLRRLLSEGVMSGSEQRSHSSQSQLSHLSQQSLQTTSTQGNPISREPAASRAAETAQSGFEVARQAQQAIDILGTGGTDRLRERVSLMFNSRTQAAEMRLDPPDLGRLNIRLNMSQEQATLSFQVTTPQAREALEQSLPRLREMLAEQGIALADANVSEQQQNNSEQASSNDRQQAEVAQNGLSESDFESEAEIEVESTNAVVNGRVDYFV